VKSDPARRFFALPLLALGLVLLAACAPVAYSPPSAGTGAMAPAGPPPPTVVVVPPPVIVVPPPPPSTFVVFFSEPNYRGESFMVEAGAGVENLARLEGQRGSWNNRISSFRIEGVATVVAFTDANFRGERLETASSLGDLVAERRSAPGANWDHAISSLRVVPVRGRVFDDEPHFDARTAENVVRRVYRDTLFRDPDADGLRHYRDKLMNEGWTEDMLRSNIRQSGEFHAINPDEVIARAYREVLHRDPDPEGLRHYHQLLTERGWTEPQLRADLLRSSEESATAIRNLITRAYRDVLGREPDPAGFANYEKAVREKGWTERQVRDSLMKSDEYRQKRSGR
jgi:hypothetical protein